MIPTDRPEDLTPSPEGVASQIVQRRALSPGEISAILRAIAEEERNRWRRILTVLRLGQFGSTKDEITLNGYLVNYQIRTPEDGTLEIWRTNVN